MKNRISMTMIFLLAGWLPADLQARDSRVTIVPGPQEVTVEEGAYLPAGRKLKVNLSGVEGRQREIVEEELQEMYAERYQAELSFGTSPRADILIALAEEGSDLPPEGYELRTEKKSIVISAADAAGLYYGVQSLKQLLRGNPDPHPVPLVQIRDWPDIGFRCIMDDISRGPIPAMDFLKEQVRRYAEMKINHMSFYIEHVVQTEKYPDMAPSEGGISIAEFSELSAYAADYHMKLVGNFQSLGHFEKILSLPQFRHLGATERMLDPLNPEALEFLGDIYEEMAPAFSSEYFTPNLDEAWDLSRGGLKGPAAELGPARIYADHATAIDSMLRALGKKTIIWGDIVLEHPEILDMVPEDVIMGAWNYSPSESFADYIDPLTDKGFDFTVAPGVLNSRRLIPDFRMSLTNIRNFINEGYEKGCIGVYCTVWDDGGLHFFSHDWYGLAYNAEQSWRPNREPVEDFDLRFSRGIYGDVHNALPLALQSLNKLTDLGPTFEMNSNVFYKALVPERGSKVTFDPGSWTGVKEHTAASSALLETAAPSVYGQDLEFVRFTIAQYDFMADSRILLLEAAAAYEQACALQRDDREAAMEQLNLSRELCGGLKQRMDQLAEEFLGLWDLENRAHWRDRAELDFARHRLAFARQQGLLEKASLAFAGGAYLPPPTEVMLDVRKKSGQYFPYWLLAGSFHLDAFEEYPPDFLKPMGGEAEARPFPGMRFTDTTGVDRMWIKYDSPKEGELDFKSIFEPHITAVAYAYCTIDAPEAMDVTGLLGSNDGATVWLNGKEVHHFHGKRSLIPDEDEILLDLEEGRNHLLIKVEQWKGGWGLAFRLKDVEVRYHKQKYYIQ